MRSALQAAARTDWRPIHAQMGQGTPLGNLFTDAVIRRLDTDSRVRTKCVLGAPAMGTPPWMWTTPVAAGRATPAEK
eukprot:1143202-Pyramimonas_sp.AAC.1